MKAQKGSFVTMWKGQILLTNADNVKEMVMLWWKNCSTLLHTFNVWHVRYFAGNDTLYSVPNVVFQSFQCSTSTFVRINSVFCTTSQKESTDPGLVGHKSLTQLCVVMWRGSCSLSNSRQEKSPKKQTTNF